MMDAGRHPRISMMTLSEVEKITGYVGNFHVKILQQPRYVHEDKCTACNECSKICPVQVPNEFDVNLSRRKAIYFPFPQAVPASYVIDDRNCLNLTLRACGKCKDVCEPQAIDYDQEPEIIELNVSAIIIATGYELFNPDHKKAAQEF